MRDLILRHSLSNALEHDGKADVQAVIGSVLGEDPSLKSKVKELFPEIRKIVEEVNSYSIEKQRQVLGGFGGEIKKEPKEEGGLPGLPNAETGKVILRMAPFPSGPLHIGNSRMAILNSEYAKKYKGKLFLVFDDTIGSEDKPLLPEAYELIEDSLKLLKVKYDKKFYKSDRLEIFYKVAKELIEKGVVYVCHCDAETLRRNRVEGVACGHRSIGIEVTLKDWELMLKGKYKEGGAVLRLKSDMNHPNPAFRDRVLMRIANRKHPRVGTKYKVWPMLEFSWAVDDHLLGITHIIRGKDLVIEDMMEKFIWNVMGWKMPEIIHHGFLRIGDAKLSKTQSRKSIQKGVYSGWDDPRIWSVQSLIKRGIQPEAIRNFVINMGLSMSDVAVPEEILYSENRKLIDAKANRYLAVLNPVQISVGGAGKIKSVKANLHPEFAKRGKKTIPVDVTKVYVEKSDFEKYSGKEVGLINLFSVRLGKKSAMTSKGVGYELPKVHWVSSPNAKTKIAMPDGSVTNALAEPNIKKLKEGDLIQLYRVGFCRVGKTGKDTVLYFAHK